MQSKFFLFLVLSIFVFIGCSSDDDTNPDLAAEIAGSYTMSTYVTHSGTSTPSADDKIVVSKVDEVSVSVTIDYASSTATDVTLNNMAITEATSGDDILLTQSFDNAESSGTVSGDSIAINVVYDNGNFVNVTASKQ